MAKLKKQYEIKNQGGKAKIKIIGEISWWRNGSEDFTRMVDTLLEEGVTDVDAYINSGGGDMFQGGELRNQIARFPGHKYVKLGALCASAATSITTVFDEIESSTNTSYMMHDPTHGMVIEHEEDFDSNKKLYLILRNQVISDYVALSKRILGEDKGLTSEEVSEMMRATTWMNSQELVDKGLAHRSGSEDQDVPEDSAEVANRMNFTLPVQLMNQLESNPADEDDLIPPVQKKNKAKMKNLILVMFASWGVQGLTAESADQDVANALKQFVQNKLQAFNSLVDQLKSFEGFSLKNDYSPADLIDSVKNFIKAKNDRIIDLENSLKKVDDAKLEAVYDIARTQKGYTDKQIENLRMMAKNSSIEAIVNFLEDVPDKKDLTRVPEGGQPVNSSTMAHAISARLAGIKNQSQKS